MEEHRRITVLGPLTLSTLNRVNAAPSAPKERKILVLLLLNHEQTVPVSVLIDELWGEAPPKSARTALQTHVMNVRRGLTEKFGLSSETVRRQVLTTSNDGYSINFGSVFFDLREYLRLIREGQNSVAAGNHHRSVELFQTAEALWQGPVLSDVEHGMPLRAEVTRLEQLRLASQETCIESELRLGRHRELIAELSRLTLQNPYHERLHEYLMLALHRAGRRVQALEVFHRLRKAMMDEVGLVPSGRVQRLQEEILHARDGGELSLANG
ncbi:Transcriptional regulatory protein EmbR [Actinomadura rubteroloni]|uniref:Transcriptional regulatory protein EmbR n=1 Tax=Actinomadura rubteroloni TaxID=1926885 RepID=A0A2P4UCR9_9ACTN|nr:AfsR/SARP family transcriptional regulator [Actinomadura rubteroloni]POM22841.1 Transcriptional regulatory protein EmbR [Actinomadura rubteroloni]